MSMLVPRNTSNLFGALMADPFDAFFDAATAPVRNTSSNLMRTDIKETDAAFEIVIDLPGFDKENVSADLKDGYLTITAKTLSESQDSDEKGTYLRKERFSGKCSRTFYVGEDIEQDDVKAKFENGILKVDVPKKQEQPQLEETRSIAID